MAKKTDKKSYRKKHATYTKNGEHKFPIGSRSDAMDALKLRGHASTKQQRRQVINKAKKYAPEAARKAMKQDKKKGLI